MKRILFFIMAMLIAISGSSLTVSAKTECEYCKYLSEKGFPDDYCEKLCRIHFKYPKWNFEAINISQISVQTGFPEYSFEYCISKECDEKDNRNLVSSKPEFSFFRKKGSVNIYDSGMYPASKEAVSYLMDPRNFLEPNAIFQFLRLDVSEELNEAEEKEKIEKIISGCFLSDIKCENYPSFADAIINAAKSNGINALFLASRLRSEQGKSGNALAYGTAGDILLRLDQAKALRENALSLNGYYDLFNMKAGGNGQYEIFKNAAKFAKEMGWTTAEASLFGGAEKLKDEYISLYQNTPYFQKWNIDARSLNQNGKSRNFTYQYMQNIFGAVNESNTLFLALSESGLYDTKLEFLIPIFSGMPEHPFPDPSNGAVKLLSDYELNLTHIPFISYLENEGEDYVFAEISESEANADIMKDPDNKSLDEQKGKKAAKVTGYASVILAIFTAVYLKTKKHRQLYAQCTNNRQ